MELKIFNSILFGELQPFTGENKNEEYFANKMNPKISVSANMDNFEEQLNLVLKDHPLFSEPGEYLFNLNPEENKIEITSQKAEIFEPLIDIDIPPTFNCTTEFYLYLITNEARKVKTKLISEISTASNQIDALNNIRITITQIEFLLKNLAIKLKALPKKGIPYYKPTADESETERIQMNTHFVFYVLKLTLIRLYYDMEILFSSTYDIKFKNKIQFYSEVVGEKHPAILAQDVSKRMAISSARVLTGAKDFKKAQAFKTWRELIEYFQKDQSNHEIEQALAAIENKIFLESNNVEQMNCTFEELKSQILCDAELASAEAKYNEIVGTKDLGYERLEVIEELLDLIFKNFMGHNFDTINIQNSIPRNLYKWLVSKASLYRNGLTFSFASQEIKKINNLSNEKYKDKKKLNTGFKLNFSSTDDIFSDFHNSLKSAGFINSELPNFRKAFIGSPNFNKIKWLKYQNELNYLITALIEKKIIKRYSAWVHAKKMFTLADGSNIPEHFRTNSYSGQHLILDNAIALMMKNKH